MCKPTSVTRSLLGIIALCLLSACGDSNPRIPGRPSESTGTVAPDHKPAPTSNGQKRITGQSEAESDSLGRLIAAVQAGDPAAVRSILSGNPKIKSVPSWSAVPLFLAAADGHTETAKLFLDEGADPNAIGVANLELTPLMVASEKNHPSVVELLLDRGAAINAKSVDGATALSFATGTGNLDLVRMLIDRGADVNSRNDKNWTVLMEACDSGHADVVRLLLDRGADPGVTETPRGLTAAKIASIHENAAVVALLKERGIEDKDSVLREAIDQGDHETIERVVNEGASADLPLDRKGRTPLMFAVWKGDVSLAELLLRKGANPDAKDRSGTTPLMFACERGRTDLVRLLLDKNADHACQDGEGQAALHMACRKAPVEVISLLLEKGANPDIRTKKGATPLIHAAERGDIEVVRTLLDKRADPSAQDSEGRTALDTATRRGHVEVVTILRSVTPKEAH